MSPSRRELLVGGGAAALLPADRADGTARFLDEVRRLETGLGTGGRIGVRVIDPQSGRDTGWRAHERFPMCSTFKLPLAGAVLWRAERGREQLTRRVAIPRTGLPPNSPTTSAHAGATLSVGDLCAAAVTRSDNGAANLLLDTLGGPAGLTRFLRASGDPVTRLDRIEPVLNEATPGDPRDTTTPGAMLATLHRLTAGPLLAASSRTLIVSWLRANTTGGERLRKGLPPGWTVGDKTGAGGHNSNNDVALIWPPRRAPDRPARAAVYVTGGPGVDALARNPALAAIGRALAELLSS